MRITTVFNKLLSLQGAFVRAVQFQRDAILVSLGIGAGVTDALSARSRRRPAMTSTQVRGARAVVRADPIDGQLDFEDLVAWLAREMNKTAVTRLAHIAWETVGTIVERVVGRNLDRNRLEQLYVIGIDEVSYRKGHKYLCGPPDRCPYKACSGACSRLMDIDKLVTLGARA